MRQALRQAWSIVSGQSKRAWLDARDGGPAERRPRFPFHLSLVFAPLSEAVLPLPEAGTWTSRAVAGRSAAAKRSSAGKTTSGGPIAYASSMMARAAPPNGASSSSSALSSGWIATEKPPELMAKPCWVPSDESPRAAPATPEKRRCATLTKRSVGAWSRATRA